MRVEHPQMIPGWVRKQLLTIKNRNSKNLSSAIQINRKQNVFCFVFLEKEGTDTKLCEITSL